MPRRTGTTDLWLVSGGVPHFKQMVKLAGPIAATLVNEYGTKELIKRLSNPCFFSSLACTLGFEWNTSGQTTVTLSALRQALKKENLGIQIVGGKGKLKTGVPKEIVKTGDELGLTTKRIEQAKYASQISIRVDSSALQDLRGQIYCHTIALDEKANWAVIQQKMDIEKQKARRYHWFQPKDFVNEPHSGIAGSKQQIVLDLTASKARICRTNIVDIVKERPNALNKELLLIQKKQTKITDFFTKIVSKSHLEIPKRFSKAPLQQAREADIKSFEQLLAIKGIGPATIRGLAYISALLYGSEPSWSDPARYQFAFGTKTGKPFYVQKAEMAKVADILKTAVQEAKLGKKERLDAVRRLKRFIR